MATKKKAAKPVDQAPVEKAPAAKKAPAVKAAKKAAAKAPAKKAAKPAAAAPKINSAPAPGPDAIARAAYLNYRRRVELGLPGDSHSDWVEAERTLANGS